VLEAVAAGRAGGSLCCVAPFTERSDCPSSSEEVFTFEGGASVAFFYVPADQALTPPQHLQAIWLEFEVEDVARTTDALARLGIEPFEYEDRTHPYFQAPGGQVFRLATKE
jgi:hypothetical protein